MHTNSDDRSGRLNETGMLTYDSDRLIREWRDRYANRRTVSWQMLDEATALVRDAILREREQEQRQATIDRNYDLERREREVERAAAMQEQRLDRMRRQVAEAEAKIASLSPRMTLMREERETVEDGTIVRLLAPTVPSYGDKSSPRPWMLGELEDVIHRLRMGGGGETTEVRFKRDAIEACVPFAEFALARTSSPVAAASLNKATSTWPARRTALAVAAVVLILALLAGVVL